MQPNLYDLVIEMIKPVIDHKNTHLKAAISVMCKNAVHRDTDWPVATKQVLELGQTGQLNKRRAFFYTLTRTH